MIRTLLVISLVSVALISTSSARAQKAGAPAQIASPSAQSIFLEFEIRKIEALEKYLVDFPNAEDLEVAQTLLTTTYLNLGVLDKAAVLLEKRYDSLDKSAGVNLQGVVSAIIEPLFGIFMTTNDKANADRFSAKVKEDFGGHPQAFYLFQMMDLQIAQLSLREIGKAVDIKFTAANGEEIDLASMRGKVVFIDFWATWCAPCLAELPIIKSVYENYKDNGFEVIGISMDVDKEAMNAVIEENQINWPNHFDEKGPEGEFPKKFGISAIPASMLIGKDGTIAATNLRGHELEKKVAELLK